MYHPVKDEDFIDRMIEITVWDYDRIGASEFLGEVSGKPCFNPAEPGYALPLQIVFCLFRLRFYGPFNRMGSGRVWSVFLTTLLLGRLSSLCSLPVLCTFLYQKLTTAILESAEGRE